jgi:hypothetical protein
MAIRILRKGKRFTKTGKWKISSMKGRARAFTGTLLKTFNLGRRRIAIFSVPKRSV